MVQQRQKMIGVTPQEKRTLDRAKEYYETQTNNKEDWGSFLSKAVIMGLVALGVYKLVEYNRDHPMVACAICAGEFPLPYSEELPRLTYIYCPHCGEQLVVDYGEQQSDE